MRPPSVSDDPQTAQRLASYFRAAASPGAAVAIMKMNRDIDVRKVLPATRVPTLILHRTDDITLDAEHARYLAQHIPGAKLVELAGEDHPPWLADWNAVLAEVEIFLTGEHQAVESERVLATVLFADIVGFTTLSASMEAGEIVELLKQAGAKE